MSPRIAVALVSLAASVFLLGCPSAHHARPTGPAPEYEPGRTWVGTGASAHPVGSGAPASGPTSSASAR